jgi:hypothetical protein
MPTSGKFVALLLLSVVALYLSDQYDWFAFNKQKGWTVLIAVASVTVGLVMIFIWSAAGYLLGRKAQFGLSVLLLMMPTVAVPLAWLSVEMQRAKQLTEAIARIKQQGGGPVITYKLAWSAINTPVVTHSYGDTPKWLRSVFGDEFFAEVEQLNLREGNQISELKPLRQIRHLETGPGFVVNDRDLATLAATVELESIDIWESEITDAGLSELLAIPTLKEIFILKSKTTLLGREELKETLKGRCDVRLSEEFSFPGRRDTAAIFRDAYSLEYIEPGLGSPQERSDSSIPTTGIPPPPVGEGIWPYGKSDDD